MNKNIRIQQTFTIFEKHFKEYYQTHKLSLPDRFSRREFAFMFFGGRGMLRHLSFTKKQEYQVFLQKKIPAHCYYSTAYYQKPDAQTMTDKKWMGAELIFDLDSDHLPNMKTIPYEIQLKMVKEEFIKLVDDFLLQDFGFEEKDLELYFSGGRGYHCHVKNTEILHLDSGSRREIVDYITGKDLIDTLVFHEFSTGTKQYRNMSYPTGKSLTMPSPNESGWRGRISRGLIEILDEIKKSEHPVEQLKTYGVDEKTANKLLQDLSIDRVNRIKKGKLDQSKTIRRFFLNNALRKTAVSLTSGETDEPVTCDIKRLIRLPGSLHGKTGFCVKKVSLNQLENFNPLSDAIVFSDEKVKIELLSKIKIHINNSLFDLSKGKQSVPLYLALFLIGKKQAVV
jgi:DNA primase small subunit